MNAKYLKFHVIRSSIKDYRPFVNIFYTDQVSQIWLNGKFWPSILFPFTEHTQVDSEFISAACWIQGVYIYPEMSKRMEESAYFGMPKEMNMDGLSKDENGVHWLCQSKRRDENTKRPPQVCEEMEKVFYLQVRPHVHFCQNFQSIFDRFMWIFFGI